MTEPVMTPGAFQTRLRGCEPGESFVYYTGHIAFDSFGGERNPPGRLAEAAYSAYHAGQGCIIHRRICHMAGPGRPPRWDYVFIKGNG